MDNTNTSSRSVTSSIRRRRRRPNVLITGTPGTGKTTLAALIVEQLNEEAAVAVATNGGTTGSTAVVAKHINVGEIIQVHQFYDGHDDTLDTYVLDEDQLIDYLDEIVADAEETNDENNEEEEEENGEEEGGTCTSTTTTNKNISPKNNIALIADYHVNEIFPQRYFDLIVVLRTTTEVLYDRYVQRNYNDTKRMQNIQCEIMNVVYEEAMQSYDESIVHELQSNTIQDIHINVQHVMDWIHLYIG